MWETLVKPGKKLRPGAEVSFGDGSLTAKILDGLTESSSTPILRNVSVRVVSAPSSPQIPTQAPPL